MAVSSSSRVDQKGIALTKSCAVPACPPACPLLSCMLAAPHLIGRGAAGVDVPDVLLGEGVSGCVGIGSDVEVRTRCSLLASPLSCFPPPSAASLLLTAPSPTIPLHTLTPPPPKSHLGVLHDCPVAAELAAAGRVQDGAARPLVLVQVDLVHLLLCTEVVGKVVGHQEPVVADLRGGGGGGGGGVMVWWGVSIGGVAPRLKLRG